MYLRVITLPDGETVRNAFPDRDLQEVRIVRISYHPEMESMFIHLSERPSVECVEIHDGVVLDFDSAGNLVRIDIDKVSSLPEGLVIPERLPTHAANTTTSDSRDD